jgi:hypothetical protein
MRQRFRGNRKAPTAHHLRRRRQLMESFVAIMALVAACIIDPGVYFAMNSPMAVLAPDDGLLAHLISDMRQRFRGNRKAPTAHHLRRRRHPGRLRWRWAWPTFSTARWAG